jgi:RimJ/RimL family protein N-acetyltransferase
MDWSYESKHIRLSVCNEKDGETIAGFGYLPSVAERYFIGRPQFNALEAWVCPDLGWERFKIIRLVAHSPEDDIVGWLEISKGNVGYIVDPRYWNSGVASEMVQAVIQYYAPILGLTDLRASILRENTASIRVVEKNGFRFDGIEKRRFVGMQGFATMVSYHRSVPQIQK